MNRIVATTLLLMVMQAVWAQTDVPPALPAAKPATGAPAKPTPRRSIELSPAERQRIDDAAVQAVKPASVEQSLAPTPDEIRGATPTEEPITRIEQTRTASRTTEVTVTPAHSTRSYVMTQREDRQPLGVTQMNSGLSVPMFFRIEFGRTTPPTTPTATPPAPPATPSR